MGNKNYKSYILLVLASIFWGASFVFIKVTYKYVGPVTMIFTRMVISSVVLISIYALNKNREHIDLKDIKLFILMAICEPFLYFIGEGYGMQYVSSTHASVIVATIPIFTMIGSFFVYKEKISKLNVLGVFISFLGIIIMIGLNILKESSSGVGFSLMFLAVIAAVTNSLLLFRLGNKYSPLTIITVQNFLGALLFLPLFLTLEVSSITVEVLNSEFILSIIFLSLFPSVLSFVFNIYAINNIGITKTSIFSNFIPVVTGISSFIILGTLFKLNEVIGIVIVLIGLFMTQRSKQEITYEA